MIGEVPRPSAAKSLTVRAGCSEDLDAVMTIMAGAFSAPFGEAWTRSQCAGILPMAGVALRLAEYDGQPPCGFSLLRTVGDEAELLLIGVDPGARKAGVGAALVDDFIAIASERGATNLHLEVRDGNAAITLYRRAGFSLVGRRRDYYHGPTGTASDALTLSLILK